jgi:hypothetical protein
VVGAMVVVVVVGPTVVVVSSAAVDPTLPSVVVTLFVVGELPFTVGGKTLVPLTSEAIVVEAPTPLEVGKSAVLVDAWAAAAFVEVTVVTVLTLPDVDVGRVETFDALQPAVITKARMTFEIRRPRRLADGTNQTRSIRPPAGNSSNCASNAFAMVHPATGRPPQIQDYLNCQVLSPWDR